MKRMIACEKCSHEPAPYYPGEWFKRVTGTAKKEMICDYCYPQKIIPQGAKCAAESMGVNGHGIPYYQWEGEYIQEATDAKP